MPPVPSAPQVLSSTVYQAATMSAGATSIASLPHTGAQSLTLAMIALVAMGAGVGLLLVRRRRSRA